MDVNKKELTIEFNEIKKLLDLSSNLFKIRTAFFYTIDDEQYTAEIAGSNGDYQNYCRIIQQELKHKCIACDRDKFKEASRNKKPLLYRCYNGLYEMFLPLFIENSLVGYLHFGQVRAEDSFKTVAEECNLETHSKFIELEKSYNSMEIIDKSKLILVSELFQKFSEIILKNQLIKLKQANPEYYLKNYIKENLDKSIDINSAAKFVGRSRSFVTHNFKKIYGKSFHEYLCQARIDHAKTLLRNHSISDTSQLCGFKNRYHFSKVFKKIEGVTPHEHQLNVWKTRDEE
jgi:ligand-binding sensor protein